MKQKKELKKEDLQKDWNCVQIDCKMNVNVIENGLNLDKKLDMIGFYDFRGKNHVCTPSKCQNGDPY